MVKSQILTKCYVFAFDTIRSIKNSPRWISGAQTMKAAPDWGVYILLAMSCFCLNNPHMQVLFFFCFRSKPLSEMPFHCDFKTRLYISTLPAVNQQTLFLLLNTVKKKKNRFSLECSMPDHWAVTNKLSYKTQQHFIISIICNPGGLLYIRGRQISPNGPS